MIRVFVHVERNSSVRRSERGLLQPVYSRNLYVLDVI